MSQLSTFSPLLHFNGYDPEVRVKNQTGANAQELYSPVVKCRRPVYSPQVLTLNFN